MGGSSTSQRAELSQPSPVDDSLEPGTRATELCTAVEGDAHDKDCASAALSQTSALDLVSRSTISNIAVEECMITERSLARIVLAAISSRRSAFAAVDNTHAYRHDARRQVSKLLE